MTRTIRRRMTMVAVSMALFASSLLAGQAAAAEYPQVGSLRPFTAETNYMSLPGYLRYLVFLQEREWISRSEAVRIVMQQDGRLLVKEPIR